MEIFNDQELAESEAICRSRLDLPDKSISVGSPETLSKSELFCVMTPISAPLLLPVLPPRDSSERLRLRLAKYLKDAPLAKPIPAAVEGVMQMQGFPNNPNQAA